MSLDLPDLDMLVSLDMPDLEVLDLDGLDWPALVSLEVRWPILPG